MHIHLEHNNAQIIGYDETVRVVFLFEPINLQASIQDYYVSTLILKIIIEAANNE